MLATSANALPVGPMWTYEVKWDGYRALAVKEGSRVQLISRNQKDLTRDYPAVVGAIQRLDSPRFVLDGEIVAIDRDGRPSFQALQHRSTSGLVVSYYAFDVLRIEQDALMREPLDRRRERLRRLVAGSHVFLSEPLPGTPRQIEREIRRLGLEGVVAKRRESIYRPGQRTDDWIKVKFQRQQEFVVGGYKPNGPTFDSILVGYYQDGRLHFAGKVRNGFTPHLRQQLMAAIGGRPSRTCPFVNLPNSTGRTRWGEGITAEDMNELGWAKPAIVVEVAFNEWTRDGLLRHPRFVAVRDDKPPRAVVREDR